MTELVGQQLGNYRLNGLLGRGGFAAVYLGEHIYLKTLAAIKVLHLQLTNEAHTDFLNEARMIARLEHPHIVHVLEFGVEMYLPFLVMSYAPNGTLRHRYPKGTVQAPSSIIPYVKQIASALDYAHERKLVHRDVKPENILLDASNKVLLSDFGLATFSHSLNHIQFQDGAGTAAYVAPEQIQGKPCAASDQYALGVAVYEWLTGTWPFEGSDVVMIAQHLHALPPPMCEKVPTLIPEIEQVVMRALSKEPARRFPCVQDFALALEQASSSVSSVSSLPTLVLPQFIETRVPRMDEMEHTSKPPEIATPQYYRAKPSTSQHLVAPEPVITPPPIPPRPIQHSDSDVSGLACLSSASQEDTPMQPPQTADVAEPLPLVSSPQPEPASPSPLKNAPPRFTRRGIILSLVGAGTATAMGAGLAVLFLSPTPPSLSGIFSEGQQNASGSTPASTSGLTGTSTPGLTPTHTRGLTPTNSPVRSPAPSGIATPTPATTPDLGPAPTPTPSPTSAPTPALSMQIENAPSSVTNGHTASLDVLTNEPNVTVTLNVSYNVPPPHTTSVTQTTDNNGQATLSWQVDVRGNRNNTQVKTILDVSAVDPGGKQAPSQQLTIPVDV